MGTSGTRYKVPVLSAIVDAFDPRNIARGGARKRRRNRV
jgi:hypothetical protein